MSHCGRCRRRPRCRRAATPALAARHIEEEQFLDVAFDVDKRYRESIIEEREKEKEVFEDVEEKWLDD